MLSNFCFLKYDVAVDLRRIELSAQPPPAERSADRGVAALAAGAVAQFAAGLVPPAERPPLYEM